MGCLEDLGHEHHQEAKPQTNDAFRETGFIPSATLTHGGLESNHLLTWQGARREHVEDLVDLFLGVVEVGREADEVAVGPADDAGRRQVSQQLDLGRARTVEGDDAGGLLALPRPGIDDLVAALRESFRKAAGEAEDVLRDTSMPTSSSSPTAAPKAARSSQLIADSSNLRAVGAYLKFGSKKFISSIEPTPTNRGSILSSSSGRQA